MNSVRMYRHGVHCCDLGFGTENLRLCAFPDSNRLSDDLFAHRRDCLFEAIVLAVRGNPPTKISRLDRLVEFYKSLRIDELQRRTVRARALGKSRALNAWRATQQNGGQGHVNR